MKRTGILEVVLDGNYGWCIKGFILTTIDQIATKAEEFYTLKDPGQENLALCTVKFSTLIDGANNGVAIRLDNEEADVESVSIGFLGRAFMTMCPHRIGSPESYVSLISYAAHYFWPDYLNNTNLLDFIPADRLDNWYAVYHSGS